MGPRPPCSPTRRRSFSNLQSRLSTLVLQTRLVAQPNVVKIGVAQRPPRTTSDHAFPTMRFTKMQGAGNDYIYVDCFAQQTPADPPRLAREIADRHYGVGGDGLILICPSKVADAEMRMFNADGSESEMCGNGIRCVAKYVYDHGIAHRPTPAIETGRGVLTLDNEAVGRRWPL